MTLHTHWKSHGRWLATSIAVAAVLVGSACRTPVAVGPGAQARVGEILRQAGTEKELSLFLGLEPERCIAASRGTKLCQWVLGNRDNGYRPLSQATHSNDRIGVICELPADGRPRKPGSCTAHPRRSNRYASEWKEESQKRDGRAGGTPASGAALPAVSAPPPPAALAQGEIEGARTLVELSRLMGAIPRDCAAIDQPGQQLCVWTLSRHVYGQGTVAAWIDAPVRKKSELRCVVPTDGGVRLVGSCSAEVL